MLNVTSDALFINFLNNCQTFLTSFMVTFLLVAGVISNTLNIIVSSREKMLKSTVGFYYVFISIFNILTVILAWIKFYPQTSSSLNVVLISG